MALNKGSVTIAPTGDILTSTGLAGRIFDNLDASTDYGSLIEVPPIPPATNSPLAVAKLQLVDLAEAISNAVIDEFIENAEVSVDEVVTEVATGIPVTVVVATGIGATTAPGAGAGTGTGSAGQAIT